MITEPESPIRVIPASPGGIRPRARSDDPKIRLFSLRLRVGTDTQAEASYRDSTWSPNRL
eukprot:3743689-Rhodomonas_salina.1